MLFKRNDKIAIVVKPKTHNGELNEKDYFTRFGYLVVSNPMRSSIKSSCEYPFTNDTETEFKSHYSGTTSVVVDINLEGVFTILQRLLTLTPKEVYLYSYKYILTCGWDSFGKIPIRYWGTFRETGLRNPNSRHIDEGEYRMGLKIYRL